MRLVDEWIVEQPLRSQVWKAFLGAFQESSTSRMVGPASGAMVMLWYNDFKDGEKEDAVAAG